MLNLYIEILNLRSLLFLIRRFGVSALKDKNLYYVESKRMPYVVLKFIDFVFCFNFKKIEFKCVDLKDGHGTNIRERIHCFDLLCIRQKIITSPFFKELYRFGLRSALDVFIAKLVGDHDFFNPKSLSRTLYTIQAINSHTTNLGCSRVFILGDRPWMSFIHEYASALDIKLVTHPVGFAANYIVIRKWLVSNVKKCLVYVNHKLYKKKEYGSKVSTMFLDPMGTKIYKNNSLRSEYFFMDYVSNFDASQIIVPISNSSDNSITELKSLGSTPISLFSIKNVFKKNNFLPYTPVTYDCLDQNLIPRKTKSKESKFLTNSIAEFCKLKQHWVDLFQDYGVKLFLTWYKYDHNHIPIAEAIQECNGVMAIWQNSFVSVPSPDETVFTDIFFHYSPHYAQIERKQESKIKYLVSTGFLGDYRFERLSEHSLSVRQKLLRNGAKNIIAFFDIGSQDERWFFGHERNRKDYEFILTKLIETPSLGLIVKSKTSNRVLSENLGETFQLLREAQMTNRCHYYEYDENIYPPAAAALAADICIQSVTFSCSAAVEAALAGKPSLVIDREGWKVSPLYQLGISKVVFTCWDDLWKTLEDHLSGKTQVPGLGDWKPLLNEIDPFRDGRAAERMANYLDWIMLGFKDGLSRDATMEIAAEKYCKKWGSDKVCSIN